MNFFIPRLMRINEIFYSLQGEGRWTGHAAVFVRFSGCNLQCPFCDTAHGRFTEMTVDGVMAEIGRYPSRHVVLTGGEPALQVSPELLAALKGAGWFVQMETNGSVALAEDVLQKIDWITCSPKDAPLALGRVDEVKVLYRNDGQPMEGFEAMGRRFGAVLSLQPCDVKDAALNRRLLHGAVEFVKANPQWALSLQTHKLIDIK